LAAIIKATRRMRGSVLANGGLGQSSCLHSLTLLVAVCQQCAASSVAGGSLCLSVVAH